MPSNKTNLTTRIVTDVVIISLLHLSYFVIKLFGHQKLGFDCNDNSLRLPLKENTVSTIAVSAYGYLLPVLTMGQLMYNFIATFLIAAGICFMLTTVIKYSLGRLRPNFWEACKPYQLTTCIGVVDNYQCTNTDEKIVEDTFVSFVSGHASTTAVGVAYSVLYLQERLHLTPAPLIRPLIQTIYIATGFYVCITRTTDFKHHPTDVFGGMLLGTFLATFYFFRYLTQMSKIRC